MKTVTKKGRSKGSFKGETERSKRINLRLTPDELDYIDKLCAHLKANGAKKHSRADIIIFSVRFVTILERMEMNLMEVNGLFDLANFNPTKYTK